MHHLELKRDEHLPKGMPASADINDESRLVKTIVEVSPFDDGTNEGRYRVRNQDGRQYLLPKLLADLLTLLDGDRTITQVSEIIQVTTGVQVNPSEVSAVINREFVSRGLVRPAGKPSEFPSKQKRRFRTTLDFVLRWPIISEERVEPIATRLASLFSASVVIPSVLLILLVQVGFYSGALSHQTFLGTPRDMCLAYLLAIATVFIHEFGHAAASRRFGCEHGEIGFCLYLIFPALYLDLSRAWRLPRRQRAVIDIGGIYFQLMATVPLYLMYRLTGESCFAGAFQLVDIMVLWAINPLVKFDGYWLLVDWSGLANLQSRSIALLRDAMLWPIQRQFSSLIRVRLRPANMMLLVGYASVIGGGILVSGAYMLVYVPKQFHELIAALRYLPSVILHSPSKSLLDLVQLATAILFFVFLFRFVQMIVAMLIKRNDESRRTVAFQPLRQTASDSRTRS